MSRLSTIFAKNRAEELPDDLYQKFVIPLNYLDNNLLDFSKSTLVVGGRGSGKTVFLKYHCFPTLFSSKKNISKDDLNNIGIYWRPDTDFSHMMTEEYLDSKWKVAFEAYIGLSIFSEFSKMVNSFVQANYENDIEQAEIQKALIPEELCALFGISELSTLSSLDKVCQIKRSELNDWLNYPEGKPPIVFAAKEKWLLFINFTLKKLQAFQNTTFHIFIDEYENLPEQHQVLINTWIKHSQSPLIIHVAYKKHSIVTANTMGKEKIVDVNDYRIIDLEQMYENSFDILAAEIILSKFNTYTEQEDQNSRLYNINSIEERQSEEYQNQIKAKVRKIFPALSMQEVVNELFDDSALVKKLEKMITDGLTNKGSSLKYQEFIDLNCKKESLINAVLLHRRSIKPDALLSKFKNHDKNFYNPLINNNLLGAILYIYTTYQSKTSSYFAGFDRFILLSQANIRHLLELCYQSIIEYETKNTTQNLDIQNLRINTKLQAIACKRTSKTQIEKIAGLGDYGKDLQKVAIRLGKLFLLSQKRPSQSIAEVTQFTIKGYEIIEQDNNRANTLINECKVWGILKEEINTKQTGNKDNSLNLYILHPIFSPHFGISNRKKRKLDLTYNDFQTIFLASETKFQKMHRRYAKAWETDDSYDTISYNSNSLLDFVQ